jgi:hypothetical protein
VIRSSDPDRIRASLGFLLELALQARSIRGEVERLQDHEDRDIALRARDLIAAMDAVQAPAPSNSRLHRTGTEFTSPRGRSPART